MEEFRRIKRLPPYVFSIVNELKVKARAQGDDIIDFGMGNPDLPTPPHIVEKLCEAVKNPRNHRYSASRGITKLRMAIADWYGRRYGVEIDPEREAIATIGAKEGISHGALVAAYRESWPPPKLLILSFPHNPTTATVDLAFFEKVVAFAQEHHLHVIHDFAYADLTFDDYRAPSFLQVPGAKAVGVEFFTLSKSYNMPGWRVGFAVGNPQIISALTRIKSYLDYGMFQPIQIAAIVALNGPQECVKETVDTYRVRRDVLVDGLDRIGWSLAKPKGTMFVLAKIPDSYRMMGALEFSKFLIDKAKVAVSPGIGFGQYGDEYIRFALVENEHRTRQAIQGIKRVL